MKARLNIKKLGNWIVLIPLLSSCVGELSTVSDGVSSITGDSSSGSTQSRQNTEGVNNVASTVTPGYGRYLKDNPIALSNNYNLPANENLAKYLNPNQDFITNAGVLRNSCIVNGTTRSDCYGVKTASNTNYFIPSDNKWAYPTATSYFRQVQAYGNLRDIVQKFHANQVYSYNLGLSSSYQSAHPAGLFSSIRPAFWFPQNISKGIEGKLLTYSDCNINDNAFFSPARLEICLGKLSAFDNFWVVTDPTVTFHEVGHAFNQVMLNSRNIASGITFTHDTNLGYQFYDEAGAIGEGLADYFSFYMNHRGHFAEWALGFLGASRPLEESDPLHAPGIGPTSAGRISYPDFIPYDPNYPRDRLEDIHFSGQIISHFFVALVKDMQGTCGMNRTEANQNLLHLIMETFAEMGDQTGLGYDGASEATINHSQEFSHDWISKVNPINFRTFIQVFSKYFKYTLSNSSLNMCNGTTFPITRYESLVDDYGLLLFKTYNENGNGLTNGHSGTNTQVTPSERIKSVLIDKRYLRLDSRPGKPKAFIIDDQADIAAAMDSLKASGQIEGVSSEIDPNFAYNNGNGKISPGEVVGISLSLYNNSNSIMGGVQVLANDWDHTKGGKPCNTFEDEWPSSSEGAADLSSGEGVQGGCDYITRYNGSNTGLEPDEEIAPVCFVEINETNSTKWYQQSRLLTQTGLDASNCLGGSDSKDDCFVRAIKGADYANYSMIDPKATWAETITNENGIPTFNFNNVIFFEINPWIPPGTVFNCRMRARFTNCEDCYHDDMNSDDNYKDFEFSGDRPFRIINFSFTVID